MLLWFLFLTPLLAAAISPALRSRRVLMALLIAAVTASGLVALALSMNLKPGSAVVAAGGWLFADALSLFHILLMLLVYILSTMYALVYFRDEEAHAEFTLKSARLFTGLWLSSLAAMSLVLVSNNLAIMWVGIEATTLLTAFLICLHRSPSSLEAMWKYLLICSVGVTFAFAGILLTAAAARDLNLPVTDILLWSVLRESAAGLNPVLIKAAFIFILVGYGTKAGLAPMHTWLPDAHSQAPAPVSAIFSGFMLNAALYCIMRFLPIIGSVPGLAGWSRSLLSGFGVISILLAAVFIIFQRDLKRFLAYCSVEHIGIIALGLGLGPAGTFAALFHTVNHSLAKALSFFAAGRLGQIAGSHDMRKLAGCRAWSPLWAAALFISILALIGAAPFSIFISEILTVKAAVEQGRYGLLALFLIGTATVFIASLGYAISLYWGSGDELTAARPAQAQPALPGWSPDLLGCRLEYFIVAFIILILLGLGVYLPTPVHSLIESAASVITINAGAGL